MELILSQSQSQKGNKISNTQRIDNDFFLSDVESKYGFYETFNDKNIKKAFSTVNTHNMDKKYNGKIPLTIVETILFDNGQFSFWNFTDQNGFVMKRSQKRLNKENVILYLITRAVDYISIHNPDIKIKKSEDQILSDIDRFTSLLDQKIESTHLFNSPEYNYLNKIHGLRFILVHSNSNAESNESSQELKNLFDFNKILSDSSLLSGILMAQILLNVIKSAKPLICKYSKKNELAPKKMKLFTEKPIFKIGKKKDEFYYDQSKSSMFSGPRMVNQYNNQEGLEGEVKVSQKETELILLNDANLTKYIEDALGPFIKLIEKSKKVFIHEGMFRFVKMSDIYSKVEYYAFIFCEKIVGVLKTSEEYKELQAERKVKMSKIKEKTIPKDLLHKDEENFNFIQTRVTSLPRKKTFKHYERITKDAFCFGEFCDYSIPKIFKNLKKNTKIDEINSSIIPKENKFSERDKMHNLPNTLPVFLIKKAYDNPNLVNIVLKAYSIFPSDFDKDAAIREVNRQKKEEEERRKEEEKARELNEEKKKQYKMLQKMPTLNTSNLPNIHSLSSVINTTSSAVDTHRGNQTAGDKNKTVITLYHPTPQKFDHINYDTMYSKKYVCNNCYTIYTLIQNFLSNIDETTSQFKSLAKAKDLLLQGDKLKNPYENEDSFTQEQPENLLFQEEKNDFSLKSILKKNMRKLKREARKKNEKRKEKLKIVKNVPTRKEEFKKTFSYNLNVNPKLLKLNLVAEKTKNKFFNLIFNELRTEPESIYQKLGIKKPDKNFKNSMTNLRMHMGINSYSYNTNFKELNQLNKKINDEVLKEFLSNVHDQDGVSPFTYRDISVSQRRRYDSKINITNIKSFRKAIEGRSSLMNQQIEMNQTDVDIFLAFKNLKKIGYGSPFGSPLKVNLKENEKDKINYLLEEDDEDENYNSHGSVEHSEKSEYSSDIDNSESYTHTHSSYLDNDNGNDSFKAESRNEDENHDDDYKEETNKNLTKISESKLSKASHLAQSTINFRTPRRGRSHKSNKSNKSSKSGKSSKSSKSENKKKEENHEEIRSRDKNRHKTVHCKGNIDIKDKLRKIVNEDVIVSLPKSSEKKVRTIQMSKKSVTQSIKTKTNRVHSSQVFNPEMSKKITVSSIFYYEWSKDTLKFDFNNSYYYISSPLTKFNEMNIPVNDNPLLLTQNMTCGDFIKIGKFENSPLLDEAEVFVYDQYTAVPYKVVVLKDMEEKPDRKKEAIQQGNIGTSNNTGILNQGKKTAFVRRGSTAILKESKGLKCIVLCLNDFFDSFIKYQDLMTQIWGSYTEYLEKLKLIFFNFPGQSTTLFSKKSIFNNMYYTEFLDRFLFHLVEKNYFDHTYHMILVGFGNGGQVALSYVSFYEKYWDFIHSVLLFNPFCENDEFINKSMLEILKIVEGSKNTKLVDFFVKSITVNPQKLIDVDGGNNDTGMNFNMNLNNLSHSNSFNLQKNNSLINGNTNPYSLKPTEPNPITMAGYYSITRGYFYNLKINHKEVLTPLVVIHSNQNCFITINNINSIFHHLKLKNYSITPGKININLNMNKNKIKEEDTFQSRLYDFPEILPQNKIRRKLIVVDGSHDIIYDNPGNVSNILHSYMRYLVINIPFNGGDLLKNK